MRRMLHREELTGEERSVVSENSAQKGPGLVWGPLWGPWNRPLPLCPAAQCQSRMPSGSPHRTLPLEWHPPAHCQPDRALLGSESTWARDNGTLGQLVSSVAPAVLDGRLRWSHLHIRPRCWGGVLDSWNWQVSKSRSSQNVVRGAWGSPNPFHGGRDLKPIFVVTLRYSGPSAMFLFIFSGVDICVDEARQCGSNCRHLSVNQNSGPRLLLGDLYCHALTAVSTPVSNTHVQTHIPFFGKVWRNPTGDILVSSFMATMASFHAYPQGLVWVTYKEEI